MNLYEKIQNPLNEKLIRDILINTVCGFYTYELNRHFDAIESKIFDNPLPIKYLNAHFNKFNEFIGEPALRARLETNSSIDGKPDSLIPHIKEYLAVASKVITGYHNPVCSFSDDDMDKYSVILSLLKKYFFAGSSIMGFQINPKSLYSKDYDRRNDIKFYINALEDTYEFAKKYLDECTERGIEPYFKVVCPYHPTELMREDRMCIWTSYENVQVVYEIINKIIQENPYFNYQRPPILCGTIDKIIGVGFDPPGSSYAYERARIIDEAIKEVVGPNLMNISFWAKIEDVLRDEPELVKRVLYKVIELGKKEGISPENFCVDSSKIEKLKSITLEKNPTLRR